MCHSGSRSRQQVKDDTAGRIGSAEWKRLPAQKKASAIVGLWKKDEVVEGSELKAACFLELVPSPLFCLGKGNHDLVLLDPD